MRAHHDAGPQYLANEMDQLRAAVDRQPWQISRRVNFPAPESRAALADVML